MLISTPKFLFTVNKCVVTTWVFSVMSFGRVFGLQVIDYFLPVVDHETNMMHAIAMFYIETLPRTWFIIWLRKFQHDLSQIKHT